MRIEDSNTCVSSQGAPVGRTGKHAAANRGQWASRMKASLDDAWRVSKLLRHPVRHARLGVLLSCPAMRAFSTSKTKLRLKYLVEYASRSLSTRQRYQLLSAHYAFLQQHFQPRFLRAVSTASLRLWEQGAGDAETALAIDLNFPETMQTEGDLCLTLKSGRRDVYRLIFSIARGATFDVAAPHLMLVTCVQGLQPSAELRNVAALCCDVHPSDLLMAALAGVASATGIDTVIGITTDNQIANKGRIFFSYDDFFAKYGQHRAAIDAYEIALPYPQKPVADIAAKYRGRTRAKRSLRQGVGEAVGRALAPYL